MLGMDLACKVVTENVKNKRHLSFLDFEFENLSNLTN